MAEPFIQLGIDTASDDASVAVLDGARVLAEVRWHIETTASRELLARIEACLVEASVARTAISAIAVDVGPGGYGSLRAGVATAQGLALALDVPLAGIGRLEADAFPHLSAGAPTVAVHDAGRIGLAWAAYGACELIEDAQSAPPEQLAAPRLDTAEECLRLAPADARWCGELPEELRAVLAALPRAAYLGDTSGEQAGRSAADLVRLARLHRAYGDPAAVDVLYLRPPNITVRAGR